jgi:NAD(P)-dependent dehydrogenase (short-subunit alcohol dehydrogenase family)
MNNAGIGPKGTSWGGLDNWHKVFDVNVFGWVAHPYFSDLVTE